jgi:hypothetical protein
LAAVMLATAAAAAVRIGWSFRMSACWWFDWAMMAWTSVATLVLVGVLFLPGTTLPIMVLAALLLIAEESWAWGWRLRPNIHNRQSLPPQNGLESGPRFRLDSAHPVSRQPAGQSHTALDAVPTGEAVETTPPADVLQQLTRSRTADGTEELFGWLRLPFAAGQRTGSIHVAFCPPLCITPEVTFEQIEGPDARIKTAQLLPYGARFDLKLTAAAPSPTTVVLQFLARATQTPPRL